MTCNCATCILSGMFLYMTLLTCATIAHDRIDMCNYGYVMYISAIKCIADCTCCNRYV